MSCTTGGGCLSLPILCLCVPPPPRPASSTGCVEGHQCEQAHKVWSHIQVLGECCLLLRQLLWLLRSCVETCPLESCIWRLAHGVWLAFPSTTPGCGLREFSTMPVVHLSAWMCMYNVDLCTGGGSWDICSPPLLVTASY